MTAEFQAIAPRTLTNGRWRQMRPIDTVGGNVNVVIDAIEATQPERLVYAEGDSWFDKFTPLGAKGTNLLEAIRTPFATSVVDVSHIGDEVKDMVRGHQLRQTRAMFKLFRFDAILLSAGGNDLKNVFADLYGAKALTAKGLEHGRPQAEIDRLSDPASYTEFFVDVIANVRRFIDLRDAAGDSKTRAAPIFLNGYDYLQPRPAGASLFAGTRIGGGPWLYPALKEAGLSAAQMRAAADAVIDELNRQLIANIGSLPNVHVIDHRGLLRPAAPETTGNDADWLDEIHPNEGGFIKLARNRWDALLASALGWTPVPGDLVPAATVINESTASRRSAQPTRQA